MRAIFPFVLLAVAATLPACTCASSEPGATGAADSAAGAPADSAAGAAASNAAGAPAARLMRGRQPSVKLNPNLNLRNIRATPTVVAPAGSAP